MSEVIESGQEALRQLYALIPQTSSEIVRFYLGMDILEIYLGRGSGSHDRKEQIAWGSRSATLSALYQVLLRDINFQRGLMELEEISPLSVPGSTDYSFKYPGSVGSFLNMLQGVSLALNDRGFGDPKTIRLVNCSNIALMEFVRQLVPCTD